MLPTIVLAPILFAVTPAAAYESEPQPLVFVDAYDLSGDLEWDSGWQPKGSLLTIRLAVEKTPKVEQGVITEMEADGTLTWPEALTLSIDGREETGWFALVTDLHIGAYVRFDILGYKFEDELWGYDFGFEDDLEFDPLLLAGGEPELVELSAEGDPIVWDYSASVFTGVDLQVHVDVTPQGYATLSGDRLETVIAGEAGEPTILDVAGTTAHIPVPVDNPGLLPLETTWFGWLDADLALEFRPALDVCIIGICTEVLAFELPATLAQINEGREIGPIASSFPLPAVGPVPQAHDFGAIEVGNLANLELSLDNLGLLDLEGWLYIDGSDAFSVFPDYAHASPENADGTVVTFAPTHEGEVQGTLVIETNDPVYERIEVALTGSGFVEQVADPPPPENGEDGEDPSTEDLLPTEPHVINTCGCASDGLPTGGALGALGLLITLVRRRR